MCTSARSFWLEVYLPPAAARELGVSSGILCGVGSVPSTLEPTAFRPVVVAEVEIASSLSRGVVAGGLVLISPGGYRIEGLEVSAAELNC